MPKRPPLLVISILLAICLLATSALASGYVDIKNDTTKKLYPAIAYKLKDGNYRVYRCEGALPGSSLDLYAREYTKKLIWRFYALPSKAVCDAALKKGVSLAPNAHPAKEIKPPCKVGIKEDMNLIIVY